MFDTSQMTTEKRIAINLPEKAPSPLGCYSHAVKAGGLLFLCGQGARDPQTGQEAGVTVDENGKILSYDIQAQTHAVVKNLITVLEAAGCTLEDLVDVTVFLADMKDFAAYNQVYAEYFNFENPPARTTMEAKPPGKNFIEIKAIAICPADGQNRQGA